MEHPRRGAAREIGISRTTANNWSRGYKVYRRGELVGFGPALERLAVRQISARFLSQDERVEIADLRAQGLGGRQIALRLGRAPSTVSRELRRNATAGRDYRPFEAHRQATTRRARRPGRRLETNAALRDLVVELLAQRWSPQQVSRRLRQRFPDQPQMWLCYESIYQAIYQPGSALLRPSPLAPHRRSPLRTGRDHRRAQQHVEQRRPRFQQPMLTIHQRSFPPADRSEPGHWEGDLIIGKSQGSAIGTLVERQTRTVRLLHLPFRDGAALHAAVQARLADLPPNLLRSITWDQGTEMARHLEITRSLGIPVYFCDSHSPWQRGSNENMNGLPRDYFPKSTDLSSYSAEHLLQVEAELNNHPRLVLGDHAPAELLAALLASQQPSVLRR